MKITQLAIRRGITSLMIYLIAVGFGLFSLSRLNVDLYPKLQFPVIAILTQYTGVSPRDIETVLTRPIEEAVSSIHNVKKISSTSAEGLSLITLEFNWGTDMDQAEIDVRNAIDITESWLPDDIFSPLVFAFDLSTQPIMYLALSSDLHGQAELRRIGETDLEPRLERIPGVAAAWTVGGMRREIKVLVDPDRLRAHNLSIQQVSSALQMGNVQLPAGWIDTAEQEFTLHTSGEYTNVEQIRNTLVATPKGSPLRVKDVATVVDGFAEQRQRVWTNDEPAVAVIVQKQSDANTAVVCRELRKRFPQIESELPKGVHISTIYDQSVFIERSMSNLGWTALEAIGLAFLVLLFFLRHIRSSLIVAVSIPISLIVTFAVMNQAGLTLNIISMAGLALAVGLLVDNSIVVLESIFRHRELDPDMREAAYNGTTEVAMAITASTLTTLSVFVPILFVPGLAGVLFRDMVITICFSLTVSLVIALTLIPLLSSRLLKLREAIGTAGRFTKVSERIGSWLIKLRTSYAGSLTWCLHHRKTVLFSALGLFALSVAIVANLGGEFLPQTDMGFISITVDRSPGISLEAMRKSMHELDRIIGENVPEAEIVYTNFGQGEGPMAIFSSRSSSEGDILIKLVPLSRRKRSVFEVQDDLRRRFKNLADVDVAFEDRGAAMFSSAGDIVVEIFGYDLDRAEAIAEEVVAKVEPIRGVAHTSTSIRKTAPELRIDFDRQRIADVGLSTAQVGQVVRTCMLGDIPTKFRDQGDEFNVRVQLAKEARSSVEDVGNVLIMTPLGKQIPLRGIAEVKYAKAPTEILRENQERMVTVIIDISGRDLRGVTKDVRNAMKEITLPRDFRLEISGQAEDQQKSFFYLGIAMLVAVALTYMVMASQFESFLEPFVIMFAIPLSFIGVALALVVTRTPLSVMSLIGIVMLVGIVVNNGIVLIDYINRLRSQGMGLFEAIVEGGKVRMRPVLMTALTTILAMLPLALGVGESGSNWAPMARSVMGGLAAGTVLTLLVVPVVYAMIEGRGERKRLKREKAE